MRSAATACSCSRCRSDPLFHTHGHAGTGVAAFLSTSMMNALRFAILLAAAPAFAQTPPAPAAGAGVDAKAQTCAACHGQNGNSTNPMYPTLAGQNARHIYLQLKDFKEGRRKDPQMSPMAEPLSRDDMLALADHF